jgi:N6-adenosine-specific RNA methylase IME4
MAKASFMAALADLPGDATMFIKAWTDGMPTPHRGDLNDIAEGDTGVVEDDGAGEPAFGVIYAGIGTVETGHGTDDEPVDLELQAPRIAARPPSKEANVTNLMSIPSTMAPAAFDRAVDRALQALVNAEAPVAMWQVAETAETLRICARRCQLGLEAQNRAAVVRLDALRRIGVYLDRTERHQGGRPPKHIPARNGFPLTLAELGITAKIAHYARRVAAIADSDFHWYIETATGGGFEITLSDCFSVCQRRQYRRENERPFPGGTIEDLLVLVASGQKFGTIYCDPPWPVEGRVFRYPTMSLAELAALPIAELAAPRCHVHLWVPTAQLLPAAFELLDGWGLRVASSLIWVKSGGVGAGGGYWRARHETVLSATNRDGDRFDASDLPSVVEAPRGRHSEKPAIIRDMVERASPGPRLELFARERAEGWTSWGNEIVQSSTGEAPSVPASATVGAGS